MNKNNISPKEIFEKLQSNQLILVDVREVQEVADIWLEFPNIVYVPYSKFSTEFHKIPQNQQIVVFCATGLVSTNAADFLLQNAYSQVSIMDGGLLAWKEAGLPLKSAMENRCQCSCSKSENTI